VGDWPHNYFLNPTAFEDVTPDMTIGREEIFGPLASIMRARSLDEAIEMIHSNPFGTVSLEAMAMAKPIVVGAHGVVGFREQVISSGPDQTGIHVNGEDPADIAWGIKEVLKDMQRSKTWGENGRKSFAILHVGENRRPNTRNLQNSHLEIFNPLIFRLVLLIMFN